MGTTSSERLWLWAIAAVGLFGINGVFNWTLLTRLGWGRFVLLSLLGSLAFPIPVALFPRRDRHPGIRP